MEAYALEWLQLLLRCIHIVTGVAWIGASFYFVWLDNHLRKPTSNELLQKGVDGELWAVHGGGFYHPQKYLVAPRELPLNLHWFYWESYSTWISGFALFIVVYLVNAKVMMVDPSVQNLTSLQAILASLGIMVGSWLVYDGMCRIFRKNELAVGLCISFLTIFVGFLTCRLFSGRAAFLVAGAALATIMTANVFFVIIPGQRKVIAQMRAGEPVNSIFGQRGKQRSVHNTYLTLPVIFAMLSIHFSFMTSHPDRWIVLVLMMLIGALVRHFFVLRHKGKKSWEVLGIVVLILAGVFWWLAPNSSAQIVVSDTETVSLGKIETILSRHCIQCHSDHPTLVQSPPKNISFSQPGSLEANAPSIYQQVVMLKLMPLGNLTGMSDSERLAVKTWFEQR